METTPLRSRLSLALAAVLLAPDARVFAAGQSGRGPKAPALPPAAVVPQFKAPTVGIPVDPKVNPAVPVVDPAVLSEAVEADLKAVQEPGLSAAEAAGSGRRIENALTGQSGAQALVDVEPGEGPAPASVFTPLDRAQKRGFDRRYLAHLRRRDGEPNRETRRFSIREEFFTNLAANPVRWQGPSGIDFEAFKRNEARRMPEKGLNEETLWALAVAKSNRAERFGVEYTLAYAKEPAPDDPERWTQIEEFYHTRILKDALEIFGVSMRMISPRAVMSALIKAMVYAPKAASNVLVYCAELAGVVGFGLLRDKARVLFTKQPEPLARIESLFQQIIVDEVGHVRLLQRKLGPARLLIARVMAPVLALQFMREVPEVGMLVGRWNFLRAVMKADVDGAAAGYPDRFVAFPSK